MPLCRTQLYIIHTLKGTCWRKKKPVPREKCLKKRESFLQMKCAYKTKVLQRDANCTGII